MGSSQAREVDAWLRTGGIVVTASDRAARALQAEFHRARQAEGLKAWPAPSILDWRSFVRNLWGDHALDHRLLLSATQELALWADIAGRDRRSATLLDGPRHRVAALAMEAHDLLASHAPQYLHPSARRAWQQDAAAFSAWLSAFDELCRDGDLLTMSRLPLELIPLLQNSASRERPQLLTAGFDRILPVQRSLFDAWGKWHELADGESASDVGYYQAADVQTELAASALWCKHFLAVNSRARLLVVTQDAAGRRGEIERAFLSHVGSTASPLFEFSLGIPLSKIPLAKSALLLLRWLRESLEESEVDWLFSTGHVSADPREQAALQRIMRELRRRSQQRTHWTLDAFCRSEQSARVLPQSWPQRVRQSQRTLAARADRPQSPLDWAGQIPQLLQAAGWPGFRALSSTEFQAAQRWQQAVEACGSLGFDGRRISWREFLDALARALDETLFAPESRDAPIQIAGPAESAGLTADAIWFMGADEDAWPAGGSTHPLLPLPVQREAAMPHASPQLDRALAATINARLLASAPQVCFSFARQRESTESRPSRLIAQLAGMPRPLPEELAAPQRSAAATIPFHDESRVPFMSGTVAGGAGVLTFQSQCPFKAFATARLGAKGWEPAQAGLTAAQRGQLIHAVLRAIWAGPPGGIRTRDELRVLADREAFVAAHVEHVLRDEISAGLRERMPRRYVELEKIRLIRLVCEWLRYESTRHSFAVAHTESDRRIALAGLDFSVRLDRIDRLNDDTMLVIDYKSGNVAPKSWDLPRPDDVQLPLYAGFALDCEEEPLGGLVFAKVQTGDRKMSFAGRVFAPASTLFHELRGANALVRNPLTLDDLLAWRDYIEQLARDFIAGHAEADPRDYPRTCERCELPALCRIHESRTTAAPEESEPGAPDE
jgi:ATP-dependent helicase/nuclease subunit B